MGYEKVASDEVVFEIADRLTTEGKKPSRRVVQAEVERQTGYKPSMTTIHQALIRWEERQELRADTPIERAPLPEAIAEAMRDAVGRLWAAAQEETQKEIDALTQAMNERVAKAAAERDDVLGELQATAEELDVTRQQLAELTEAHQATGDELTRLSAELGQVTDRAGTAETRAAELEARVADLKAELDRAHAELQAERQEAAQARAEASRKIEAIEQKTAGEIRELQARNDQQAEQHRAELQRVRDDADKRVADVKAAGDQAQQEAREKLQRLEKGLDTSNQDAKTAAAENGKLRGQVEALQAQVAQQQDTIKALASGTATKKAAGKSTGGEKA